jgi:hypothetical protein
MAYCYQRNKNSNLKKETGKMKIANWLFPQEFYQGRITSEQVFRMVESLEKGEDKTQIVEVVRLGGGDANSSIGALQLHHIDEVSGEAQLGMLIAENDSLDVWEEAISLFLDKYISRYNLKQIVCPITSDDEYFQKLLRRMCVGKMKSGRRRQSRAKRNLN